VERAERQPFCLPEPALAGLVAGALLVARLGRRRAGDQRHPRAGCHDLDADGILGAPITAT
jgi:hypothetical protein